MKENNGKPSLKKGSLENQNSEDHIASNVINSSSPSNGPSSTPCSSPSSSPSSDPSNSPSSDPSSGSSSGALNGLSSGSSSGPSNGPSSDASSDQSSGPSSGPSSDPSIGPSRDYKKEELTKQRSHKNIENPGVAEKKQSKAHKIKKEAQDKNPEKGNNAPRYKKIRACVSPDKGFRSTFDPNDCQESDNWEALMKNDKFSVVTNFDSKGIE